jgi:hypothetical protein
MGHKLGKLLAWALSFIPKLMLFLYGVLCDRGTPSFSRSGSALLVVAYVYLMISTRRIPDNSEQFAFVIGVLYGSNQFKSALAAKLGNPSGAPGTATPPAQQAP